MIYIDTSVVLAQLLAEDVRPPAAIWSDTLVSSRLVAYETWNRINTQRLGRSHGEATRDLLARISMLELSPLVLARALDPYPGRIRTLDALHLASVEYLRSQRVTVHLASYDERMTTVATKLGIDLVDLGIGPG